MAALLAIVACSKKEDVSAPGDFADDLMFRASFEGAAGSRVSISENDNGFELAWSDDDQIAIYTRMNKTKYGYNPETKVFTKLSNNVGAKLEDYYYAAYPYTAASSTVNDGKLSMDMPASQKYAENSFGKGANTMVAICPKPAEISTEPVELSFKNVAGYLRLKLYGENVNVKSIQLKGNNDELISGQANVIVTPDAAPEFSWVSTTGKSIVLNCGDGVKVGTTAETATEFWFVVPPTTFAEGFNVRITDVSGRVMLKSLDKEFTITRNQVETMNPLEVVYPEVDESILFDAQFNADGTATDKGKYLMDIIAHPGPGMETIQDEDYPYGYVVKFTNCDGANNAQITDSFYAVEYSNSPAFKESLIDENGFTMEMVIKHGIISRITSHPWQNAFTTNTAGIFHKGVDTSSNFGWLATRYATEDSNSNPFTNGANLNFAPYINRYYHYMFVYDNAANKIVLYCDGEFIKELNDIPDLAAGDRLAIGGFPTSNNIVEHSFTGNVALARIYDAAYTADQVRARYDDLDLPSAYEQVSEPLFDAQFNADGTAENVGTANLTIETKANSAVLSTKQKGSQYVANFFRDKKHNNANPDGFYIVDYSGNADFIANLNDGYSMEVVCKVNTYEGDFWSKVMSTSTSGIHHQGAYSNEAEAWCWGMYGNGKVDNWNSGFGWGSFRKNFIWGPKVTNTYEHLVMVWDAESNVFTLFVNGQYALSGASPVAANVGTMLAVGGMPYTDKTVYHPFVGEVAVARIYDEVMSINQVKERYNEVKSTITALDAAQ